ncbi:flagellin, partial [Thermococci archaeon]
VSPNAGSGGIDLAHVKIVLSDGKRMAVYRYYDPNEDPGLSADYFLYSGDVENVFPDVGEDNNGVLSSAPTDFTALTGTGNTIDNLWKNLYYAMTTDNKILFGIIVIADSDDSLSESKEHPTLSWGDRAALVLWTIPFDNDDEHNNGYGWPPNTKVVGKVIPENGAAGVIDFTTPSTYNYNLMELQ